MKRDMPVQNIPIRTDLAREVRRSFLDEPTKSPFYSTDYEELELRILNHYLEHGELP